MKFMEMLKDESGSVMVEFAIVTVVLSIPAFIALHFFSDAAVACVNHSVTNMNAYGVNPQAFEANL